MAKSAAKKRKKKTTSRRTSAAQKSIAQVLETVSEWAKEEDRPVTNVRIRKNKDGSTDGQILIGGRWNNFRERLIQLVGEHRGEVPFIEGMKVNFGIRFEGTSASEEDPEERKYRKMRGLPSIAMHYRNIENWPDLVAGMGEAGNNVEDQYWRIETLVFNVRIEPKNMRRKEGR